MAKQSYRFNRFYRFIWIPFRGKPTASLSFQFHIPDAGHFAGSEIQTNL
jgi:hypothetical protein